MRRNSAGEQHIAALMLTSAVATLAACSEPLPPLRYETEKARIGTSFDHPLCGRDFVWIDDHISFVESVLEARSNEKIDIYLYTYDELPSSCDGIGCYSSDGYIRGIRASIEHEVVHAVVDRFAHPALFLNEGIANALTERGTQHGTGTVAENLRIRDFHDLSYLTAGHFTRWLIEDRGDIADIQALLRGGDATAIYGAPLDALGLEYEADAPFAYPPWHPCNHPALTQVSNVLWHETVELSCERPDVSGFSEGQVSLFRSVELSGGDYELRVEGGKGARLLGCQLDALDAPPPEMARGATRSSAEWSQTAWGVLFESGTTHTITLTEGTYEIDIPAWAEDETIDIELRALEPRRG